MRDDQTVNRGDVDHAGAAAGRNQRRAQPARIQDADKVHLDDPDQLVKRLFLDGTVVEYPGSLNSTCRRPMSPSRRTRPRRSAPSVMSPGSASKRFPRSRPNSLSRPARRAVATTYAPAWCRTRTNRKPDEAPDPGATRPLRRPVPSPDGAATGHPHASCVDCYQPTSALSVLVSGTGGNGWVLAGTPLAAEERPRTGVNSLARARDARCDRSGWPQSARLRAWVPLRRNLSQVLLDQSNGHAALAGGCRHSFG
jgi:hypothetical protein